MPKRGKRYKALREKIDRTRMYDVEEAIELLKECANAKFVETVELSVKLGIDPRKADQQVRTQIFLPHGTGKKVKVAVFAKGEKAKEALDAGADYVGAEELIEKVKEGFLDFDAVVATPDMMQKVSALGKILGPRGLMPSPKTGTVTMDVAEAVKEIKAGAVSVRADQTGVIHLPIGKVNFPSHALKENIEAAISAIQRAKPQSFKGLYIKSIHISSTMGCGIKLNPTFIRKIA